MGRQTDEMLNLIKSSSNDYGGKTIINTATTTPDDGYVFGFIMALETTVIDAVVGNITGLTSVTIPALTVIPGRFTSIKLSSGKVIAIHVK